MSRYNFPGINPRPVDLDLDSIDHELPTDYLRSTLVESMRAINPMASVSFAASVRLSGRAFEDGLLELHGAEIFQRLQEELAAAAAQSKLADVRFGIAQLAKGSVVLNLVPIVPKEDAAADDESAEPDSSAEQDALGFAMPHDAEVALSRALDLHDAFERGDEAAIRQGAKGELAKRSRMLVEALRDADADMEIVMAQGNGLRRRSTISEYGRQSALHYFGSISNESKTEVLRGEVHTTSLTGDVELIVPRAGRKGPKTRSVTITKVPRDVVKRLQLGETAHLRVQTFRSARPGRDAQIDHTYIGVVERQPTIPGDDQP